MLKILLAVAGLLALVIGAVLGNRTNAQTQVFIERTSFTLAPVGEINTFNLPTPNPNAVRRMISRPLPQLPNQIKPDPLTTTGSDVPEANAIDPISSTEVAPASAMP
jgi:hypothetical protein